MKKNKEGKEIGVLGGGAEFTYSDQGRSPEQGDISARLEGYQEVAHEKYQEKEHSTENEQMQKLLEKTAWPV